MKRRKSYRRSFARRTSRRIARFARKSYRRSRRFGGGEGKIIQLPAMAYGAVRNVAARQIMGFTHGWSGALGKYEDEAIMLGLSYAAAKMGKGGFIGKMGRAGLIVENASAAASLTSGLTSGGTNLSGSASSYSGFV